MNRRNFIKSIGFLTGAIPLLGFTSINNPIKTQSELELEDLYSYAESKNINHLHFDGSPFKLYPFQKQILKEIHENDKLVIVKARQIGMTRMLAGYVSWLSHRKNIWVYYCPPKHVMWEVFEDLKVRLGYHYNSYHNNAFNIVIRDEQNFSSVFDNIKHNEEIAAYFSQTPTVQKTIICGTPDAQGRLLNFINSNKDFKVVTYSINETLDAWQHRKFDRECIENYIGQKQYEREFECKFV